jgi:two-component system nitrate/nitrite sensor histidine kinase NarX
VEKHARASQVTVCLTKQGDIVQMTVHDDGIGFYSDHHPVRQKGKGGFGLLGMRERAISVGGTLKIESTRRAGTKIEVRIPLPSGAKADRHG